MAQITSHTTDPYPVFPGEAWATTFDTDVVDYDTVELLVDGQAVAYEDLLAAEPVPLDGAARSDAGAEADPLRAALLQAAAAGDAAAQAALRAYRRARGEALSEASAPATLSAEEKALIGLAGVAEAESTAQGDPVRRLLVQAAAGGSSGATETLRTYRRLVAEAASDASADAVLRVTNALAIDLSGSAAAEASTEADLARQIAAAGLSVSASDVVSRVLIGRHMAGAADAEAGARGTLRARTLSVIRLVEEAGGTGSALAAITRVIVASGAPASAAASAARVVLARRLAEEARSDAAGVATLRRVVVGASAASRLPFRPLQAALVARLQADARTSQTMACSASAVGSGAPDAYYTVQVIDAVPRRTSTTLVYDPALVAVRAHTRAPVGRGGDGLVFDLLDAALQALTETPLELSDAWGATLLGADAVTPTSDVRDGAVYRDGTLRLRYTLQDYLYQPQAAA